MHRPRRGRMAAALLAVLVLGATGATAAQADNYVALGDSYSSGTGTRDYSLNSGCQRGPYAYPYLIKQDRPNTTLNFVACSGAKTGDVLANQVSAVNSSTNIVTITIGGNDAGFSDVITECAKPSWLSNCAGRVTTAQNYIRNTLPGQLNSVYSQIKSRAAATAKVVVLGYPRLFNGEDCNAGTFFSPDDESRLNATADLLASTTSGRAAAYGFTFKDAIPPFIGHAICSTSEWLNGLSNPISDSYHPNRNGHKLGYEPLVRAVIG
jgi:lysophospholipase L1-like esterase